MSETPAGLTQSSTDALALSLIRSVVLLGMHAPNERTVT